MSRAVAFVPLSLLWLVGITACTGGPEPSYIAPVAIAHADGFAVIAFCEDINVLNLSVYQESPEADPGFVKIFDGVINQEFSAGETLTLDMEVSELDSQNMLTEFSTREGTDYLISTSTPSGGGFVGVVVDAPGDWAEGQWLPTESELSADPCEFWNSL